MNQFLFNPGINPNTNKPFENQTTFEEYLNSLNLNATKQQTYKNLFDVQVPNLKPNIYTTTNDIKLSIPRANVHLKKGIWDGSLIDEDNFLKYLINKFKDFEDIKIGDYNLKYNSKKNEKSITSLLSHYSFSPKLGEDIRRRDRKINMFIVPLGLYDDNKYGHANILIIDLKKHKIERYDPNGISESSFNTDYFDEKLVTYLGLPNNFTVVAPNMYCPFGLQRLSNRYTSDPFSKSRKNEDGYCVAWVYVYIELRIMNRNKLPSELYAALQYSVPSLKQFIRNYSTFIQLQSQSSIRDNNQMMDIDTDDDDDNVILSDFKQNQQFIEKRELLKTSEYKTCQNKTKNGKLCPLMNCYDFCKDSQQIWSLQIFENIMELYGQYYITINDNIYFSIIGLVNQTKDETFFYITPLNQIFLGNGDNDELIKVPNFEYLYNNFLEITLSKGFGFLIQTKTPIDNQKLVPNSLSGLENINAIEINGLLYRRNETDKQFKSAQPGFFEGKVPPNTIVAWRNYK